MIGGEDGHDYYLSDVHILDAGIIIFLNDHLQLYIIKNCYIGYTSLVDNILSIFLAFCTSLDTLMWRELNTSGQLLPPRAGHSTVAFGKNLFVFGGFTDAQNLYNDLHMLDVGTYQVLI